MGGYGGELGCCLTETIGRAGLYLRAAWWRAGNLGHGCMTPCFSQGGQLYGPLLVLSVNHVFPGGWRKAQAGSGGCHSEDLQYQSSTIACAP